MTSNLTLRLAAAALSLGLAASPALADPLDSVVWEPLSAALFGGAPVVFDDRVRVLAPTAAENARSVPVAADATALGKVEEIVLFADLNPFPVILRYRPIEARPVVATRFKVQQATPIRAAARTPDGVWHVAGHVIDASGGGCTAPPASYAAADWADHVGEVRGRAWAPGEHGASRVRFAIRHPQDTGLVDGIPAYFIERLTVSDGQGRVLGELETLEPVAEDPVFTLEIAAPAGVRTLRIDGRDNNGHEIGADIPLLWRESALDKGALDKGAVR